MRTLGIGELFPSWVPCYVSDRVQFSLDDVRNVDYSDTYAE
jgi:hypothetical protein